MQNHPHTLRSGLAVLVALGFAMASLLFLFVRHARAETFTATTTEIIPFFTEVFVPCAAGGTGEVVVFEGDLHILVHVTFNDQGKVLLKQQFKYQALTGTGQTTGDTYRLTGGNQYIENTNRGALPYTNTLIDSARAIGPGPHNNFTLRTMSHITVNENGEVTATVVSTTAECK